MRWCNKNIDRHMWRQTWLPTPSKSTTLTHWRLRSVSWGTQAAVVQLHVRRKLIVDKSWREAEFGRSLRCLRAVNILPEWPSRRASHPGGFELSGPSLKCNKFRWQSLLPNDWKCHLYFDVQSHTRFYVHIYTLTYTSSCSYPRTTFGSNGRTYLYHFVLLVMSFARATD